MKFYIERERLLPVVKAAKSVLGKGLWSMVLVKAVDGVAIEAGNGDHFFSGNAVDANIERPGSVMVDGVALFKLLGRLPESTVGFERKRGKKMVVTCGRVRAELSTTPPSSRPTEPAVDESESIRLPGIVLGHALATIKGAVSTEEARSGLNGMFMELLPPPANGGPSVLRFVGTDGNVLRSQDMCVTVEGGARPPRRALLPTSAVAPISSIINGDDDVWIRWNASGTIISVVGPGGRVVSRMKDGEFPDYRRVLPPHATGALTLDRKGFLEALQRAALLSGVLDDPKEGKSKRIRHKETELWVNDHSVTIIRRSPSGALSDYQEELPAEQAGSPVPFGFNLNLMVEMLGHFITERVTLQLPADPLGPVKIADSDRGLMGIVMPMRVEEIMDAHKAGKTSRKAA